MYLLRQGLQLVDCRGAESVACGEHDLDALAFEPEGEFAAECSLSGTVQAGHQHHCGITFDVDFSCVAAHEIGEFVVDDLHHHLLWFDRGQHACAYCLGFHSVAEFLGDFIVYVCVKECPADILESLRDVNFGYFAFSFEDLEGLFEPFG